MTQDKEGNYHLKVAKRFFSYEFKYLPDKRKLNLHKKDDAELGQLKLQAKMNKIGEDDDEYITRKDKVKILITGLKNIPESTRIHILQTHLLFELIKSIFSNIIDEMDCFDDAIKESLQMATEVIGDCNSHLLSSHGVKTK